MNFWKNKKVLITGGLGMIGSTIAVDLVAKGARVSILDNLLADHGGNKYNINKIKNKVEINIGDIRDKSLVHKSIKNIDVIFNLAAHVNYTQSIKNPFLDLDINCNGILNILEACKNNIKKPLVVFSSSRTVYGKTKDIIIDENHPTEPLMPYAIHKLAGEKYHLMYWKDFGVPCIIVRIANPYGPKQQMGHSGYGIVNWFIKQGMLNKEITIYGDGKQIRDYVYVSDLKDGIIKLAEEKKSIGHVFNLGSGIGTEFSEMANLVVETVGSGSIKQIDWPPKYNNIETGNYISNVNKAKSFVGYQASIDLKTGIYLTYDYYSKFHKHYW